MTAPVEVEKAGGSAAAAPVVELSIPESPDEDVPDPVSPPRIPDNDVELVAAWLADSVAP